MMNSQTKERICLECGRRSKVVDMQKCPFCYPVTPPNEQMKETTMKTNTNTPLPEQNDCMFQYATSYKYISPDIYEDTDLITLSEAKALWNKHKTQFISQLQDDARELIDNLKEELGL